MKRIRLQVDIADMDEDGAGGSIDEVIADAIDAVYHVVGVVSVAELVFRQSPTGGDWWPDESTRRPDSGDTKS